MSNDYNQIPETDPHDAQKRPQDFETAFIKEEHAANRLRPSKFSYEMLRDNESPQVKLRRIQDNTHESAHTLLTALSSDAAVDTLRASYLLSSSDELPEGHHPDTKKRVHTLRYLLSEAIARLETVATVPYKNMRLLDSIEGSYGKLQDWQEILKHHIKAAAPDCAVNDALLQGIDCVMKAWHESGLRSAMEVEDVKFSAPVDYRR